MNDDNGIRSVVLWCFCGWSLADVDTRCRQVWVRSGILLKVSSMSDDVVDGNT